MRAAWLSTVRNIDWPTSSLNSTEKNISDLIRIIDYLKDANLNTVIMQVRPASDAMYASNIEPWSSWLTGKQGKAPSPFYDPLKIAIEESHKRGMELHAWLNPYRVRLASYNLNLDEKNVAVQHPDWVLNINGDEILNPGIPEVRQHIVNVITDIITRYDVDAIHFDDYFYLEGITNQDAQTFATYPNGYTNLGDWRRNNVNELLRMIYAQIQAINPRVKFGQSPPGIWKSGIPEGTYGWNVYNSIYCDAVTWFNEQIIDYLAPQLYWSFGGGQDYGKLAPWWASVSNDRHVYPGLAYYRVGEATFDKTQIGKMISYNRTNNDIQGEVYFTANNFNENRSGVTDTLKNNYYKYPALVPTMDWKDTQAPNNPTSLRFDRVSGIGTTALTWDIPSGEDIKFYVLYRSLNPNFDSLNTTDPQNIFKITSKNFVQIDNKFPTDNAFYFVTALDWNNNESGVSNKFEYQPALVLPDTPNLILPLNAHANVKDTLNLVWNYAKNANSYSLRVATDAAFANIVISESSIIDTTFQITGLTGETEFYWSVKAENLAGSSDYAASYSFTTGYPSAPTLLTPLFQELNVILDPVFIWNSNPSVTSYHIQISEGLGIVTAQIVLDTVMTDTSVQLTNLKPGTFYSWRVNAVNQYGTSLWSLVFQLKTMVILPDVPILLAPINDLNTAGETVTFVWNSAEYANTYKIQVSKVESFSSRIYDNDNLVDTTITFSGFEGATNYYWRVRANNNGGSSAFSQSFKFSTGFPVMPSLVYPGYQEINKELDPIFKWTKSDLATEYKVQLSAGLSLNMSKLLIDSVVVDTSLYFNRLSVNTYYSWRVMALNDVGESNWTGLFQFKTAADSILAVEESELEIPVEYSLEQNYPNPFNPSTTISFALPEAGMTSLTVYNIIGQEIAVLVSDYLEAGVYKVNFDANSVNKRLTSGLYLYRLESKDFTYIKKMLLIK
ncbi:MAG: family 10 glycosylhydrolase [Bacteroidetes bacterium]|nr:family 10 glycosylhydrolase [Bacteroidota bacterium]MBU1114723.1 family 10 glycosylhydrolase [Bacteroidota bacterium]MBU1798925.1 family 10 glycosylhydrolase [Bacteroidota bacterium]